MPITPQYESWIDYQEQRGQRIQLRIAEILAQQGKRDHYSLEDVQRAAEQAEGEIP